MDQTDEVQIQPGDQYAGNFSAPTQEKPVISPDIMLPRYNSQENLLPHLADNCFFDDAFTAFDPVSEPMGENFEDLIDHDRLLSLPDAADSSHDHFVDQCPRTEQDLRAPTPPTTEQSVSPSTGTNDPKTPISTPKMVIPQAPSRSTKSSCGTGEYLALSADTSPELNRVTSSPSCDDTTNETTPSPTMYTANALDLNHPHANIPFPSIENADPLSFDSTQFDEWLKMTTGELNLSSDDIETIFGVALDPTVSTEAIYPKVNLATTASGDLMITESTAVCDSTTDAAHNNPQAVVQSHQPNLVAPTLGFYQGPNDAGSSDHASHDVFSNPIQPWAQPEDFLGLQELHAFTYPTTGSTANNGLQHRQDAVTQTTLSNSEMTVIAQHGAASKQPDRGLANSSADVASGTISPSGPVSKTIKRKRKCTSNQEPSPDAIGTPQTKRQRGAMAAPRPRADQGHNRNTSLASRKVTTNFATMRENYDNIREYVQSISPKSKGGDGSRRSLSKPMNMLPDPMASSHILHSVKARQAEKAEQVQQVERMEDARRVETMLQTRQQQPHQQQAYLRQAQAQQAYAWQLQMRKRQADQAQIQRRLAARQQIQHVTPTPQSKSQIGHCTVLASNQTQQFQQNQAQQLTPPTSSPHQAMSLSSLPAYVTPTPVKATLAAQYHAQKWNWHGREAQDPLPPDSGLRRNSGYDLPVPFPRGIIATQDLANKMARGREDGDVHVSMGGFEYLNDGYVNNVDDTNSAYIPASIRPAEFGLQTDFVAADSNTNYANCFTDVDWAIMNQGLVFDQSQQQQSMITQQANMNTDFIGEPDLVLEAYNTVPLPALNSSLMMGQDSNNWQFDLNY